MIIKELRLLTNSLDKLKNFYGEKLGLKILSASKESFTFKTGLTDVTFIQSDKFADKFADKFENPFYHFAFNIPENKFIEAKQWISEKENLIKLGDEDEFDFTSWNAHSVYFYDPAGNIVELIARHNLINQTYGKFSSEYFLNVSEIGIPVFNVKDFYEKIKSGFGIPVFSGDLKTFTAAGDDEGLLIIVPKGRRWFPDCPDAEIFPMEIKINSGKNKSLGFSDVPYKIISEE